MKISFSRKGLDGGAGKGMASPILPDGTLLSLPIPTIKSNVDNYGGLSITVKDPLSKKSYTKTYAQLMDELGLFNKVQKDGSFLSSTTYCHLDPDIREVCGKQRLPQWTPAFGQANNALAILEKAGFKEGDLFLFFGKFKHTKIDKAGKLKFTGKPLHIIYGYLQVGQIIDLDNLDPNYSIPSWLKSHPHVNTITGKPYGKIYIAAPTLNFCNKPGAGILSMGGNNILTKDGLSSSKWNLPYNVFGTTKIIGFPNPWKPNTSNPQYFQSAPIGQEFVFDTQNNEKEIMEWVKKVLA